MTMPHSSKAGLRIGKMPNIYDIIIIGGGPAGMTAAIYSLRGGKKTLIIEKNNFGGQIANSPRVENIPGTKAISGLDFSSQLFDQISDLGVEFELEDVESITKENDIFTVKTNYGEHLSRAVIIATGVEHRHTGVDREEELTGKGISYCAVCDGAFYKGEEVALIGDANTAMQYTLLLSNYCKKVTVCALFDHLFADQMLIDQVNSKENVEVFFNKELQEFKGEDEITGLRFRDTKTGEEFNVNCKAVFICIGQVPNNKKYENLAKLDARGFIIVNGNMETSTPGLYAAGDCTAKDIRQLATAFSDGAIAATKAIQYLK